MRKKLSEFIAGEFIKLPSLREMLNLGFSRRIDHDIHGLGTIDKPISKLHFLSPSNKSLSGGTGIVGIYSNLLDNTWKISYIKMNDYADRVSQLAIQDNEAVEYLSYILLNDLDKVGWNFEPKVGIELDDPDFDDLEEIDTRSAKEIIEQFEASFQPKKEKFKFEGLCQHEFPPKKIFDLYICLKCGKEYRYNPRPEGE